MTAAMEAFLIQTGKKLGNSAVGTACTVGDAGCQAFGAALCRGAVGKVNVAGYIQVVTESVGTQPFTLLNAVLADDIADGIEDDVATMMEKLPSYVPGTRFRNYHNDAIASIRALCKQQTARHHIIGDTFLRDEKVPCVLLALSVPVLLEHKTTVHQLVGIHKTKEQRTIKGTSWGNFKRGVANAAKPVTTALKDAVAATSIQKANVGLVKVIAWFPTDLYYAITEKGRQQANTSREKSLPAFHSGTIMRLVKTWEAQRYMPEDGDESIPCEKGGRILDTYLQNMAQIVYTLTLLEVDSRSLNFVKILITENCSSRFCGDAFERVKADEAIETKIEAEDVLGPVGPRTVVAIPPSRVSGTIYTKEDGLKVWCDEEKIRALQEKRETEDSLPVGAYRDGPDIMGIMNPLDHKSPLTFAYAMGRHLAPLSKDIPLPDGGSVLAEVDKGTGYQCPAFADLARVHKDLMAVDAAEFQAWLSDQDEYSGSFADYKPNSLSDLECEEIRNSEMDRVLGGQGLVPKIIAKMQLKAGEADDRGRLICNMGPTHQALTNPHVALIEKFHLCSRNHLNFKGLSTNGKAIDMGEFLKGLDDDHVVMGVDKNANDRTWTLSGVEQFVEYVTTLISLTDMKDTLGVEMHQASEDPSQVELQNLYIRVVYDIALMFLLSGVSYTSLGNRYQNDKEVGVFVMNAYGVSAYKAWLKGRSEAKTYDISPKDFSGGIHGISKLTWGKGEVIHKDEGDDLALAFKARGINKPGDYNKDTMEYEFSLNKLTKYVSKHQTLNKAEKKIAIHHMIRDFVKFGASQLHVAYEVTVPDDVESKMGPQSVVEIMSTFFGIDTKTGVSTAIPKPNKALGKTSWNATTQVSYMMTGEVIGVVQDATMHRASATRALCLAEYNQQSLAAGPLFLAMAGYHIRKILDITRGADAEVLLATRSLEARDIDGATEMRSGDLLLVQEERVTQLLEQAPTAGQMTVTASAWKTTFPRLCVYSDSTLLGHLTHLDTQLRQGRITDEMIDDVRNFFDAYDFGFLYPEVAKAHRHTATVLKKQEPASVDTDLVERIKKVLFAEAYRPPNAKGSGPSQGKSEPRHPPSSDKGGPASACQGGKGSKAPIDPLPKDTAGQSKSQPPQHVASEPKPKGKGKGKGKGGGKGVSLPPPGLTKGGKGKGGKSWAAAQPAVGN